MCALGRGGDLVGRSAECDFPVQVRQLPVVMRARFGDGERASSEIDARVRSALHAAEPLYELDIPLLRNLRPELILTQDLCRVCSVTDAEVASACERAGVAPRVISLTPTTLHQVADSFETVGEAIGASTAAGVLGGSFRDRTRGSGLRGGPSAAVIEWLDPPIVAGLWVPEMIAAAGGTPWSPPPVAAAHRITWTDLVRAEPDLVVLSPCSFGLERTRREVAIPAVRQGLADLRPRLGLWLADEAFFSRPGPRLADGVDLLRALLRGAPTPPGLPCERYVDRPLRAAR